MRPSPPRPPGGRLAPDRPPPRPATLAVSGLAALALLAAAVAPAPAQQPGVVVAAEESSPRVSLLDPGCWGVEARIPVGGVVHQVTPGPGGATAYVAHASGPVDRPAAGGGASGPSAPAAAAGTATRGVVTVLDLADRRVEGRFRLGRTGRVTDVWSGHDADRVWVATERDGRVLTLEAATGELLMVWTIGTTSSQAGAVSPDGRYLFVSNRRAGTLTVIDRVNAAGNTVELDTGVGDVALGPDGAAWVTDRNGGRLWVVDGQAGEVRAEVPSGGADPLQVERRPGTEEMWVLHREGGVHLFRTGRREPVASVDLPRGAGAMRFSSDGDRALVTLPERGLVVTVDARERRVRDRSPVPLRPTTLGWFSCPAGGCGPGSNRRHPGPAGLPGGHWDDADVVGDLWCGG